MDESPSLRGLSEAEDWIAAQARRYHQTSDDTEHVRLLVDVRNALAARSNLVTICKDLSASHAYLPYAYRHNLGFYVVYLADPEIGLQCRLHLWMPDVEPVMEKPHRHRMGFASVVLAGELHMWHYERIGPVTDPSTVVSDRDEPFHETWIDAPAEGSFDTESTRLRAMGDVALRLVAEKQYRAGASYVFNAAGIHRVQAGDGRAGPSITLTVWGPPIQSSIAYEPIGSLGGVAAVLLPVTRISEQLHAHLLAAVPHEIDRSPAGIQATWRRADAAIAERP